MSISSFNLPSLVNVNDYRGIGAYILYIASVRRESVCFVAYEKVESLCFCSRLSLCLEERTVSTKC